MTKLCKICGRDLPLESFPLGKGNSGGRRPQCKACYSKYTYSIRNPQVCAKASAKYYATDKGKHRSQEASRRNAPSRYKSTELWRKRKRADGTLRLLDQKYKYGLSPDQYAALCERNPCCALCGRADKPLVTDHNHVTNTVRARLCVNCNTALGKFGDSPVMLQKAIDYLNAHSS